MTHVVVARRGTGFMPKVQVVFQGTREECDAEWRRLEEERDADFEVDAHGAAALRATIYQVEEAQPGDTQYGPPSA